MYTRDSRFNISDFSPFCDTYQDQIKNQCANSTDSQKVPENKFFENRTVTVPAGKYNPILNYASELISWIYSSNKRDTKIKGIPIEVRYGLTIPTVSGILRTLGKPNRPKVKPEPFILCYGRFCDIQGSMCIYTKEMVSIPFPVLPAGTELVKINVVKVTAETAEYSLKVLTDAPTRFNLSTDKLIPVVMEDDDDDD